MMVEDQYLDGVENGENFQLRTQRLLFPESQLRDTGETTHPELGAPLYSQLNRHVHTGRI